METKLWQGLLTATLLAAGAVTGWTQGAGACAAADTKPCIDKIDPPGWWATLPDPMLLVHGANLHGATLTVSGQGVTVERTESSANGHWAFLWLKSAKAEAQTLAIRAENAHGAARVPFALAARKNAPGAHGGFSAADVLYLIMPDRFADGDTANDPQPGERGLARGWHGGDLKGIEQHIDYLHELGVTAVWLTPVLSNAGMNESYHGYAATDLYAVDPHLGTVADYQRLARELHARGIKLLFDEVPNHIGVHHVWVDDQPAPEWLHGTRAQHPHFKSDFYALVDPHAPRAAWQDVTDGWFTDDMPDLNQENPLVKQYLIDNAIWWVETADLDGLRIDTFPYVSRAFWHDFHEALHGVYPRLTTVGEILNPDAEVTSYFAGGRAHAGIDTGLDTPFDFPTYFTLKDVIAQDKPMTELAKVMRQDALYPHPERLTPLIGNHDTERFLTAAQGSVPKLKLGLGLLLTLRGMPQLYSGDEIAMAGGNDPDNRHDFPGGFPGDAQNAFTAAGRIPEQQDVFAWTAGLTALRTTHAALRAGLQQDLDATDTTFAFVRAEKDAGCDADTAQDRVLVVVNKAAQHATVKLATGGTALAGCTKFRLLKPTAGGEAALHDGTLQIEMAPQSMAVYAVR